MGRGEEHSTLEVTGMIGWSLETRGILVKSFPQSWGHLARKQNKNKKKTK